MPPLNGPVSAPPTDSPFGALADPSAQAGGADAQMTDTLGQLRDLASQATQLVQANPDLAQEGQQMMALIKSMIVKKAQMASQQTASSMAVPPA